MNSLPRAIAARVLLAVAFLIGSLTYTGVLYRHIALDSGLVVDASDTVLKDESVQHTVAGWVSSAIYDQFLTRDPQAKQIATALTAYGIDVKADARTIADRLVATPTFRTVFTRSIGSMHHYVMVDRSGPPPRIDLSPIVPTVREIAVSVRANYAALPDVPVDIQVSVPSNALPDATWVNRTVTASRLTLAAIVALLGMVLGVVVHSNHPKALRRVGRFFVGLGLGQVILVFALPLAANRLPDDAANLANALIRVLRSRLLAPAGIVVAIGIVLWIVGRQWRRTQGNRTAMEGRRAFTDTGPGRFATSQIGRPLSGPGSAVASRPPVVVAPLRVRDPGQYEPGRYEPGPSPRPGPPPPAPITAGSMTTPPVPPRPLPGPQPVTNPTSGTRVMPTTTPAYDAPVGHESVFAGSSVFDVVSPTADGSAEPADDPIANPTDEHPEGHDPLAWMSSLAALEAERARTDHPPR